MIPTALRRTYSLRLARKASRMKTTGMAALLMACAGCFAGPIQNLNVSSNEAVVVGKIAIIYNGEALTDSEYPQIMFTGTDVPYTVPADGWVITKLPLGSNYIRQLMFAKFMKGPFHYDLTPQQASFTLVDNQHVY